MKLTIKVVMLAIFVTAISSIQAQEKKPTAIAETLYLLPKRGMNKKFEEVIAAHNTKFHPDGPHHAALRRVEYGAMAGFYVWVMKGTYASLDSRPTEGGHQEDWDKNVDPLVEEYGDLNIWSYNEDLSYGMDIFQKSDKYLSWAVNLERGDYYRFKALVEKVKKAYESMGSRAFLVYNNSIHTQDGADVALIWSFDAYAELEDNWAPIEAYDKLYGEGSWVNAMDEWMDITGDYQEEIRTIIK